MKLQSIFEMEEPDEIADTMLSEFNNIIDTLAPPKVVQVRRNENNNLSKETMRLMEENKRQFTIAKETGKTEDYIKYRKNRTIIGQKVNEDKRKRLEDNMNDNKECWKTLKRFSDEEDTEIPTEVVFNGETIRKHQELAEIANDQIGRAHV